MIAGPGFTVIVRACTALTLFASLIFTVKVDVAAFAASGPLMVEPFSPRPEGSEPDEMLQALSGGVPPVTDNDCEYAAP